MKSTAKKTIPLIKLALASPEIKLGVPSCNAQIFADEAIKANEQGCDVILFPELALTGATLGDLYFQQLVISAAEKALGEFVKATASLPIMSFIGLPVSDGSVLYNAVAVVSEGEILGLTVSGLATRHFNACPVDGGKITICGQSVTFGRDLIYTDEESGAEIFVKIGDDNAFSSDGVNLILNPTAMLEYIGLSDFRVAYANEISEGLGVAFAMCGAGIGESGTDGAYASPRLLSRNGKVTYISKPFSEDTLYCDTGFKRNFLVTAEHVKNPLRVRKFPFIPLETEKKDRELELAVEIQSRALAMRFKRAYAKKLVIGVSGGLDSTLALLVCARAMQHLGLGCENIIAVTMPCFGTTERTKGNAIVLANDCLGCDTRTIDIKAAVTQHFEDISHDENNYDVVYENAQARERTQILMDIANAENGLVVGTGDLSELALGFATYNGDHMSMYSVNASVPKTLMRAIIQHCSFLAESVHNNILADVLTDIVNTPVSPELLPVNGEKENKQHTESIVGPYELHDFFLYHTVKYGKSPSEILSLANEAFEEYSEDEIKGYLDIFIRRFYSQQFKRSCMPDGPRVTEITLSPRSAWQMPSDISSELWRSDLK